MLHRFCSIARSVAVEIPNFAANSERENPLIARACATREPLTGFELSQIRITPPTLIVATPYSVYPTGQAVEINIDTVDGDNGVKRATADPYRNAAAF